MKVIKKTAEYTVYQKRSGRYAVTGADGKVINGDGKVAILSAEDLIKAPASKAPEVEEVSAEAVETEAQIEATPEPEAPAEKESESEVEGTAEQTDKEA